MSIINPFEEKQLRDAKDALIMDEKNLARTLFTNSYFGTAHISIDQAFELAHAFVKEQTHRFPKNDTVDGRSKE